MDTSKAKLLEKLDEIRNLILENENPDGSLNIDIMRTMLVLDFAKIEIEKTISL